MKNFFGETWKEVQFDFDFINKFRLEVSDFGRIRSYNYVSDGEIINGTMINGYRIIRLKFMKPREKGMEVKITDLQKQSADFIKQLKELIKSKASQKRIVEKEKSLKLIRKQLDKLFKEDNRQRAIHYHSLIHRLVAIYFLEKLKAGQTIVAHLDYNKLNNHVSNLKWMTREENFQHQQHSPYVIQEKQRRKSESRPNTKVAKLTVTKVMLLKKLINQNKPMKQLTKQFKVTDTQILRIKRGENWKDVPAAN